MCGARQRRILEFLVHIECSAGLYWLMGPSDVKQSQASADETFTDFVTESGPRIQHALMAALGPELGQDAASEALTYGWQHSERVGSMENPAGYLYTVGRSRGRRLGDARCFRLRLRPSTGLLGLSLVFRLQWPDSPNVSGWPRCSCTEAGGPTPRLPS